MLQALLPPTVAQQTGLYQHGSLLPDPQKSRMARCRYAGSLKDDEIRSGSFTEFMDDSREHMEEGAEGARLRELSAHRSLLLTVIGMLGVMLGLIAYTTSNRLAQESYEQGFEQYTQMHGSRIQSELDQSLEVLNAFAGLIQAQPYLGRDGFHQFAQLLLPQHPEITSVQWLPRLEHAERAELERHWRQQGLAPAGIFDADHFGDYSQPAPERPVYFPVDYAEPLADNRAAVGLDVSTRPYSRHLLRNIGSRNDIQASEAFPLVQDPMGPLAIAIYQPVYGHYELDTPEARWNSLIGFVSLLIRPEVLIDSVWQSEEDHMSIALKDRTLGQQQMICPRPRDPDDARTPKLEFPYLLQLPGRDLTLLFQPSPSLLARHETPLPLVLMLAVLAVTGIMLWWIDRVLRQAESVRKGDCAQERKRVLAELAVSDPLTGLANWDSLEQKIGWARYSQRYENSLSALCVIDVDDFREVNREHGRSQGDRVLTTVAQRLECCRWVDDVMARVGGDEFIAFLPGRTCAHEIHSQLRKMNECVAAPLELENGVQLEVSISIGVVMFELDDTPLRQLVRRAEDAVLDSRQHGNGRYAVYTEPGSLLG